MLPNPRPVNYPEIPALTGIRFFAATFVMLAHGSAVLFRFGEHQSAICSWLIGLVYIGMSTFFVLSGFVIHYNYFDSIRTKGSHGLGKFFLTRFARLYPLFFLMIATDLWWGFSGNGKITESEFIEWWNTRSTKGTRKLAQMISLTAESEVALEKSLWPEAKK